MRRGTSYWWAPGLAVLLVAASFALMPGSSTAQMTELSPGVTVEVLADYGDLGIPGVSQVRLLRLTMQPGAKFPQDWTIKTVNY